jgi:hypothetical protein
LTHAVPSYRHLPELPPNPPILGGYEIEGDFVKIRFPQNWGLGGECNVFATSSDILFRHSLRNVQPIRLW